MTLQKLAAFSLALGLAVPTVVEGSEISHSDWSVGTPLDTRGLDGTRLAAAEERIAYDPQWGNAESCSLDANGTRILSGGEAGVVPWSPTGPGLYRLTHTAGNVTYTARFAVPGPETTVVEADRLETNAVWHTGGVYLVTGTVTVPGGVTLTIESGAIVKFMPGARLAVEAGATCLARGVVFTHAYDDAAGGDTLFDGAETTPVVNDYELTGTITDDETTEYRYTAPLVLSGTISSNTHWRGWKLYHVTGDLTVASGVTLTIEPGAVVKFDAGRSLTVAGGATLDAQGTRAQPIVFTSIKDDGHGGDTNGDGDKTQPQPGDWARINANGTVKMNHCRLYYCSDTGDRGAIQGGGGTVTFDNGEIAHTTYECVRMNSGTFVSHNSVFRDSSMGFGYFGGSGTYVYNGVVADCTIACRASNKHFVNTVFYNCLTFLESTSSSADHCAFYNPPDWGAQTATQVGKNGNIWGDPLFVDAANGDFRIREGSPCVDAADSSAAPEQDYFGQPRITFTGRTNDTELAEGPLADIGICEVMPRDVTSDIDLVPEAVRTEKTATPGQLLFVKWEVRNQGGAPVDATWRDTVSLVSTDGREVVLGDKTTKSAIAVGGSVFCSGYFTVPATAEGTWYPKVNVNSYHDIFEGSLTVNNALVGTGGVEVAVKEVESEGEEGVINAGAPTVKKITLPETGGNRMVRIKLPAGVTIRWGFGFVPTGNQKSGTLTSNGQDVLFRVPDGVTDVYVSMESDDGAEYDLSLEEGEMVITSVSPNTLPSSGCVCVEIKGAGFSVLNNVFIHSVENVKQLSNVTFVDANLLKCYIDCSELVVGRYDLEVRSEGSSIVFQNAFEVFIKEGVSKLTTKLYVPPSMRQGRISSAYIEYENTGETIAKFPIFNVRSPDEGVLLSLDGTHWSNVLHLIGIGDLERRGIEPGRKYRQTFYVRVTNVSSSSIKWAMMNEEEIIDTDKVLKSFKSDPDGVLYKEMSSLFTGTWGNVVEKIRSFISENYSCRHLCIDFNKVVSLYLQARIYGKLPVSCKIVDDSTGLSNAGIEVTAHEITNKGELRFADSTYSDDNGNFTFMIPTNVTYSVSIRGRSIVTETGTFNIDVNSSGKTIPVKASGRLHVELKGDLPEVDDLVVFAESHLTGVREELHVGQCNKYEFLNLYPGKWSIGLCAFGTIIEDSITEVQLGDIDVVTVIRVPDCIRVTGVVVDENGVSISNAMVVVESPGWVGKVLAENNGKFSLLVVGSGKLVLQASAFGFLDEEAEVKTETTISFRMKSIPIVTGSIEGLSKEDGNIVLFWSENGSVTMGMVNESGYYQIALPIGSYIVSSFNGNLRGHLDVLKNDTDSVIVLSEVQRKRGNPVNGEMSIMRTVPEISEEELSDYENFFLRYYGVVCVGVEWAERMFGYGFDKQWMKGFAEARNINKMYIGPRGMNGPNYRPSKIYYEGDTITELAKTSDYTYRTSYDDLCNSIKQDIENRIRMGVELKNSNLSCKLDFNSVAVINPASPLWWLFGGMKSSSYEVGSLKGPFEEEIGNEVYEVYVVGVKIRQGDRFDWQSHNDETFGRKGKLLEQYNWATSVPVEIIMGENFVIRIKKKDTDGGGDSGEGGEQGFSIPQSCDPNEMAGPLGLGDPETERYVKPGEWMTYTVYFENRADATAAAQEVRVTNPLSPYLDWSTFEMGEIAFNNQIDLGLSGKRSGTSEAVMKGTNTLVRTQLTLNEKTGIAEWYLRIVDPTTATGWPEDVFAGFLPPNDETFRGEGHLTYRVKVRDDAPHGVRIDNSASIVFDYNEPIETDPSWWNTVARTLEAGFAEPEVAVDEGGTATVAVRGGSAERAVSVQVYLAYQTASAADLDLKNAAVDGATPKGGLRFPLTLSWAAGEIGVKTLAIPVKADRAVENEELFTLQLANAQGMGVGDASYCTVTVRDANAAADYAAKQSKTTVRTKKGVPDCALSVSCAARDGSGEPCGYTTGQGTYYAGCRASLRATARPGWAFAGWGEVVDGVTNVVGTKAGWTVTPTNDTEIVALFERIPYIRALADPADGGKASGSGYCAAGKKVALKATANRNFTFAGWYAAGAPDAPVATTPTLVLDRSAKPAKGDARQTVLTDVDGDAAYFARFVGDPEVSVAVSATDGRGAEPAGKGAGRYVAGTVTGAGRYAPGKKAVLKATANRGYVFAGWREAGADGTLSRSAAYTIGAMPPDDVALVAAFVTADEDRESVAASLGGLPLAPWVSKTETHALATNVRAGVYLEWPLAASALSETTVKVAGLPAGLRFAARPVTSRSGTGRSAVLVTNVPANTVYGAPTAASRTAVDRRTGAVTVTPSAVKVTVTTAGRSSRTYQIDTTVDPLPAWAQGTFSGVSYADADGAETNGLAAVSVTAAGKVSAKQTAAGRAASFTAPWYDRHDAAEDAYHATLTAKVGAAVVTNRIAVYPAAHAATDAVPAETALGVMRGDLLDAWQTDWRREPWKGFAAALARARPPLACAYEVGGGQPGTVSLKFGANGAVTAAGTFATGVDARGRETTAKASCSATLLPQGGDRYLVFVYFPPKGTFRGHARCLALAWDGAGFVEDVAW